MRVRANACVPAYVTLHSCLVESTIRGSQDMFPKPLQIFHSAVDDHVVTLQLGLQYSPGNS